MLRRMQRTALWIALVAAVVTVLLALGFCLVAMTSMGGAGYVLPGLAVAVVAAVIASRLVVALRHA
jgi:ABC-type antimicrobial peptide transport system permease subunit